MGHGGTFPSIDRASRSENRGWPRRGFGERKKKRRKKGKKKKWKKKTVIPVSLRGQNCLFSRIAQSIIYRRGQNHRLFLGTARSINDYKLRAMKTAQFFTQCLALQITPKTFKFAKKIALRANCTSPFLLFNESIIHSCAPTIYFHNHRRATRIKGGAQAQALFNSQKFIETALWNTLTFENYKFTVMFLIVMLRYSILENFGVKSWISSLTHNHYRYAANRKSCYENQKFPALRAVDFLLYIFTLMFETCIVGCFEFE